MLNCFYPTQIKYLNSLCPNSSLDQFMKRYKLTLESPLMILCHVDML